MKPLRYCVAIDHGDWTRGDPSLRVSRTIELAGRVDQAGLDSIWLNEDPDGWDAFALLGALSRETSQIRLGTGVTNPYLRHPNLLAASGATLETLAPGRTFVGIGRGQPEWYHRSLGIPQGNPLARLEEAILLMRSWWDAPRKPVSLSGQFEITHWRRSIVPPSAPPIYLAAAGPRALALAGSTADGVLFNELATPEYLAKAIQIVKQSAVESGRNPELLRFFANPAVTVTDDPLGLIQRKKNFVATVHVLPGMDALLENPELDVEGIMQRVRLHMKVDEVLARGGAFIDLREQGDLPAAVAEIPDALVDRGLAIGSIADVRKKLHEFAATGVTHVFLDRRGLPGSSSDIRELLNSLSH